MRYADDEIREYNTPQKLFELTSGGRVSTHLLRDVLFIAPDGRVVVSGLRPNELAGMSNRSDRDYFRIHLDGRPAAYARIGHSMRGRRTGAEVIPVSYPVRYSDDGRPMGVLVALIDIEALERIWVDIGFMPEDRIELIGQDNKVWFAWAGGRGQACRRAQQDVVAHHLGLADARCRHPRRKPWLIARAADPGGR